jgi:exosortase/archaeosortase family protein
LRREASGVALALVVLAAGFALAETGLGRAFGDAVAAALAALAAPLLHLIEPGLLQSGTELRSPDGWAVRVSEVCDGHGLAISLAAALAPLSPGLTQGLWRLLGGLIAIQLFNLVRIVVLAVTLDRAPGAFDLIHAGIFPFLTAALLAVCVLAPRTATLLCLTTVPLAVVWLLVPDVAAWPLVPPSNLLLGAIAGHEVGLIAERAAGWTIGTELMASQDGGQVARFLAPLRPADFALAVPVLLAAILLARRPLWLAGSAAAIVLTLAIAAVATVWTLAAAQNPATLLIPQPDGGFLTQPFTPPATGLSVLRLAQSVLVHFNLLVLPFLILAGGRSRA